MRLGIDASNIRAGGGVTHLAELLRAADPGAHGFSEVTVWAGAATIKSLPTASWLRAVHEPMLDRGLATRVWWNLTRLSRQARASCDILFVPGGRYSGAFTPFVSMSQNLLPFDRAASRLGRHPERMLRMDILNRLQSRTFLRADGVIFLTESARRMVMDCLAPSAPRRSAVIPHGIADAFRRRVAPPPAYETLSEQHPFRWLYVSIVDFYKHQSEVAHAVGRLRRAGAPVAVDFVGPAHAPALAALRRAIREEDPAGDFLRYAGPVSYDELSATYHAAAGFIFASSCENMPNILLEAMAAGLPIACSNRSVMPEVGGDAVEYFDPYDVGSIAGALDRLMRDAGRRGELARRASAAAAAFNWKRCADETFRFLAEVASEGRSRTSRFRT